MAPASALHANLSADSTLSNDSLSENSTSSLDHEVRLSNARSAAAGGMGGGGRAAKDDRDMTEDEVAIMVKNALRKARRAMNNSSPVSDDDDDDDDDDDRTGGLLGKSTTGDGDDDSSTGPPKFRDAIDSLTPEGSYSDDVSFGMEPNNNATSTRDGDEASEYASTSVRNNRNSREGGGSGSGKRDLAKRIEEEIQSARAFAEKKYYSTDENDNAPSKGEPTPLAGADGTPDFPTPRASPSSSRNAGSIPATAGGTQSRDSARERMARSKDKIAAANEKLMKKDWAANPRNGSPGNTTAKSSYAASASAMMMPTTPGNNRSSKLPPMSPNNNNNNNTNAHHLNPKTPNPKTPGMDEFDAILAVSPNPMRQHQHQQQQQQQVPHTVMARSPTNASSTLTPAALVNTSTASTASALSAASNGNGSPKTQSLSNDPEEEEEEGQDVGFPHNAVAALTTAGGGANNSSSVLTPNSHILNSSGIGIGNSSPGGSNNKPPLSAGTTTQPPPPPPPNTNSNKPQHHRQVLFRHPYPLPPPPPLPRGDAIIISSHSAPEKKINTKWVLADSDLAALIEAAGEEHNLVRRSNACGALKVLASKDSNKPKLCRTEGLLDVLVKASWDDAVDSDALDARTRAVTTLLYLSEPKDNRLIVAKHPQVLEVLVKVIEEDTGEARWRATSTLATLAKTPGNRGGMCRVDKLATILGDLMVVGVQPKEETTETNKDGEGGESKTNGGVGKNGNSESREDHSTIGGEDSMTRGPSFDTMDDERMLTQTYTGTFTEGTGGSTTFTEDDLTYQSAYDSDTHSEEGDEEGSHHSGEDEDGSQGSRDSMDDDDNSVEEEEGVEMQISSLKKLNIENASDFLAKSQLSACATLTHLTKHCANAPTLCANDPLLNNIIFLAGTLDSPLHTRCIEMLCNFTRFPSNNARLASISKCIDTLLHCGKSKVAEDRMWSIRTVQNLCSDASSKVGLATGSMLALLSTAAMRKDYEEQYAAVGALMNLSTEPGSIVPLTNTKTVVATLVHLAHSPNTPGAVRKIACDSLATIGLWLQTLASAGTVPEEIPFSPLPTHSATGWLRWDN